MQTCPPLLGTEQPVSHLFCPCINSLRRAILVPCYLGSWSTSRIYSLYVPSRNQPISHADCLVLAMFILYTVAPLLYRMASSTYYNISLLTSDFYGLLFGMYLKISIVSMWSTDHPPSGLLLFVRIASHLYFTNLTRVCLIICAALFAILVILSCICSSHTGSYHILLACYA